VEGSLKRLHTDHIDLYSQHRVDPETKIEDTVGGAGLRDSRPGYRRLQTEVRVHLRAESGGQSTAHL
jgi:diketogulonate reductase-like aldo/keto reductase